MGIYTEAVQKLYVAYVNRPADTDGLGYWEAQLAAHNGDAQLLAQAFAGSSEYRALYAGMSNAEIVNQVYLNLFARPAEESGLRYWANLLDARQISITDVVTAISAGAANNDLVCYRAKVSAAQSFTAALDTQIKNIAYGGENAGLLGRQFIASVFDTPSLENARLHLNETIDSLSANLLQLTSATDTLQGSAAADVFFAGAHAQALNSLDTLDGAEGQDSLAMVVSNGSHYVSPSNLTVSNIETINLAVASSVQFDSSTWLGVSKLNSASRGDSSFKAASETNLRGFVDLQKGLLQVDGGHDVHFNVANLTPQMSMVGGAKVDPVAINIGSSLAPTGAITLTTEIAKPLAVFERGGVIKVHGGSSVSVIQNEFLPRDVYMRSVAAVQVSGTELTKSVNIKATAPIARFGHEEEVLIRDVHAGSNDQLGSISTVTLEGHSMTTIQDNALRTLNVSNVVGNVVLENAGLSTGMVQTLALNLNNVEASIADNNVYKRFDMNLPRNEAGNVVKVHALGGTALDIVSVTGEGALSFVDGFAPANLKTLQVAGKLQVEGLLFDRLPQVSLIDLSGNAGASNFTIDPNSTAFIGGANSDTLTLNGQAITKNITLGNGDDVLHLAGKSSVPTSMVSGGAGIDRLSIDWSLLNGSAPTFLNQFNDFEMLSLSRALGGVTLDMSLIPGITNIALLESFADVTLHSFAHQGTLHLNGQASGVITLANPSFAASTTDSVNLELINFSGNTSKLVIADVEQLKLTAVRDTLPTSQSSPAIMANALQQVSIAGNATLALDITSNSLNLFDASSFQGPSLRWTSGALQGAVQVNGSASGFNLFDLQKATAASITYQGGAGVDVLTVAGGAHTIKLGGGADHVRITAPSIDSKTFSTLSDAHRGVSITLPERGFADFQSTKIALSSTASLQNYLDAVIVTRGDGSVNAKAAWFQWNGDTYYAQSHHDVRSAAHFVNGTDIVVKLTGLLDLSAAHMASNNTLTLL